ncbi:uncharacterized protein LOC142996793 [Genypterus blacodes]|uniref:uncharacterized protein LOC142996793 n=1 Tax=Genypterus blacodes TaxID=154954 RepID=UPI003F76BCE7
MSADDFQTRYASVMESVVRSAIAETTKLFETMVNDLNAEISRIKKENEDLKSRCTEFENVINIDIRKSPPYPGPIDATDKRDTAIQCDLLPKAMLMELCQSLRNQEEQNASRETQEEQSHGGGHFQVPLIVVKQEEDVDPVVLCREIINDIADSAGPSAGIIEAELPCVSQAHSIEELTLLPTNEETPVDMDVPSKAMDSRPSCYRGTQSHTPEPEHQLVNTLAVNGDIGEKSDGPKISATWTQTEIETSEEQLLVVGQQQSVGKPNQHEEPTEREHSGVISHAAISDHMGEQCEVSEQIMQTHFKEVESISSEEQPLTQQQSEIEPLGQEQQSVFPQHHQREVEMPMKEQMCVIAQQDACAPGTDGKLSEASPFSSDGEDDMVEDESSVPHRHKKKLLEITAKNLQSQSMTEKNCSRDRDVMFSTTIGATEVEVSSHQSQGGPPRRTPETTIASTSQQSKTTFTSSSSTNISPVIEAVNNPLREMKIIRRGNSSRKTKPPQSQSQQFTNPSTEDPSATETHNTPSTKLSQKDSVPPRERHTSHASLQDALLFVEAMNAQNVEEEPTTENASSQTSCAQPLVTLKMEAEGTAKVLNPVLPQTLSKTVQKYIVSYQNTTVCQAHIKKQVVIPCNTTPQQQPLTPLNYTSSTNAIVVPRQLSSLNPRTVSILSETQLSSVVSTVIASHKNQPTVVVPCKKSLFSVLPTTTSTSPPQKLTIVIPRQGSALAARQRQSSLPPKINTRRNESVQTDSPVAVPLTKLVSSTQQSSISVDNQTASGENAATLPQKKENSTENPESLLTTHVPKENCSFSPGLAQTSVSLAIHPTVQPKLSAVVKLTKLPFPLTAKESVLVQKTVNGSIEALAIVGNFITACESTSSLDTDVEVMFVNYLPTPIRLTSINSQDTSDPHLQMSKSQFLTQLAVSSPPSVQVQLKDFSSNSGNSRAACAETSASNNSRTLQKSSLVARLRNHLKACLQAETSNGKPESLTETKPSISTKNSNVGKISTQTNVVGPPKRAVTEDEAPLTNTPEDINSITPRTSRLCKDRAGSKKTVSEANSLRSRSSSIAKHSASPKNNVNESTCTNPSKSCLTKSGTRLKRLYSSRRGDAKPKQIKLESTPPIAKWSRFANDGISPEMTREPTGAIKATSTAKKSPTVVKSEKLTKAAKSKKLSTLRELQNGAKKGHLTKSNANCDTGRKYKVKSVWTPPRMPPNNSPSKVERSLKDGQLSSPNEFHPVKPKTSPSSSPPHVYPPSVSLHPIPVRAPPIVSPLQPLSVIGWRLLRNQCGACGRVLSSAAALESHVSLHTGRRPFACKLCGKGFPDSKGLKRHGRVHRNGRIHVCPKCGKGFVYSFGLTKHIRVVHNKIKPFGCQVCSKAYFTKRDMEAHMRVHTGEKPFHCTLCERQFARRVELNVHLRWHNGEKRHWCPYCGKGFLDSNNLKRHQYIHTGEKPQACPHCPKRFTQSGHLKKHVKNVHKIQ